MEKKHKVLIMRCDDYDAEKISGIIKEGMEELNVRPAGRIPLSIELNSAGWKDSFKAE